RPPSLTDRMSCTVGEGLDKIQAAPCALRDTGTHYTMALKPDSYVVLNDGNKMPVIGFGTYAPETAKYTKELSGESTKVAIDTGYRHIDSAFIYGNEVQIGQAIRSKIADGTVKREDIFYTGKLSGNNHTPERVRLGLEKSLKDLQLDYMDLFLIHTPVEFKPGDDLYPTDENGKLVFHNTDIRETWKAMEACRDAGLVRSIGVSNFNRRQLELILNMPGLKYKPVCNQVHITDQWNVTYSSIRANYWSSANLMISCWSDSVYWEPADQRDGKNKDIGTRI
ncbi:unnamed protein product, partial [Ranitomeya imitator]